MLNWLSANAGTLIVSALLLAAVAAVVIHMVRQKRQGKSSCGCGGDCSHCAGCGRSE